MEDQLDWVTEHKGGRKERQKGGSRVAVILTFRLEGLEGSRAGQASKWDTLRMTESALRAFVAWVPRGKLRKTRRG